MTIRMDSTAYVNQNLEYTNLSLKKEEEKKDSVLFQTKSNNEIGDTAKFSENQTEIKSE